VKFSLSQSVSLKAPSSLNFSKVSYKNKDETPKKIYVKRTNISKLIDNKTGSISIILNNANFSFNFLHFN